MPNNKRKNRSRSEVNRPNGKLRLTSKRVPVLVAALALASVGGNSYAAISLSNGSSSVNAHAFTMDTVAERVARWHFVFNSTRDGDADVYASSSDGRRVAAISRDRSNHTEVIVSPDGRWILIDRWRLVSADGLRERRVAASPAAYSSIAAFSPNGRLLVVANRGGSTEAFSLIDLRTMKRRHGAPGVAHEFSPDGRFLLYLDVPRGYGVLNLASGRRRLLPRALLGEDPFSPQRSIGWSPSSRWLGFTVETFDQDAGWSHTLYVVDPTRSGAEPKSLVQGYFTSVQWFPRDRLGFSRSVRTTGFDIEQEVATVDASTGVVEVLVRDDIGTWTAWARDGTRFAYYTREQTEDVLTVVFRGGGSQALFQAPLLQELAWSPDGRRLAVVTGHELTIVDVASLTARTVARSDVIRNLLWSPDSDRIAFEGPNAIGLAFVSSPKMRTVFLGGRNDLIGWVRGPLSSRAPRAAPAPRVEIFRGQELRSRGRVIELASNGPLAVALFGKSRVDCSHMIAWDTPRRLHRFSQPAACPESAGASVWNIDVADRRVTWTVYGCEGSGGTDCYTARYNAPIGRLAEATVTDEARGTPREIPRPTRAPPRAETIRGVSLRVVAGVVHLRHIDGRIARIHRQRGVVDAELEATGLFYAYNVGGAQFPGRVVFIPFNRLFPRE